MFPPGNQFGAAQFANVKIAVGEAISPNDYESFEQLRDAVRSKIETLRNGLPNFDLYNKIDSSQHLAIEVSSKSPQADGGRVERGPSL